MDAHCGPALWGSCRAGLRAPPDAVCSLLFLCSYCCTVTSLTANDAPRCGVSLSWTVETLAAVSLFRGWCFSFVSNLFATSLVNSLCPWESFVGFHVLMRAEKNVWCLLSSMEGLSLSVFPLLLAGPVGLHNIGQTCCLNSLIQVLVRNVGFAKILNR